MIAAIFFVGQAIRTTQREHQAWKTFAALHHCKEFGYMTGDAGRLALPDRPIPPHDRIEYRCDDNLSYWR